MFLIKVSLGVQDQHNSYMWSIYHSARHMVGTQSTMVLLLSLSVGPFWMVLAICSQLPQFQIIRELKAADMSHAFPWIDECFLAKKPKSGIVQKKQRNKNQMCARNSDRCLVVLSKY
jgi:hypothetical protein